MSKAKPKILVAEDERDIRELIGFTLRVVAQLDVVLATNGIEAVEKALLEKPDLIVLDVRMPKMTGYEACRQLKENPETGDIPIIFLSAKGQEDEIKEGLSSGADEYILKPFAPDELTRRVKNMLQREDSGNNRE